jgi:DNA-binding NarL/FixJ family response regulator
MPDNLELAHAAFTRLEWSTALTLFIEADQDDVLAPNDLERAARAGELCGRSADADRLWQKAFHGYEALGDHDSAARCAHSLGMSFMQRGDMAQASGWHSRATRILGDAAIDSATTGLVLLPIALQALFGGDPARARPTFIEALAIGERFRDADLIALSRLGIGQSLVGLGQAGEGIAFLDEAMVAVTGGEVTPIVAGIVYCSAIGACYALFDLRRAREWTDALSRWCQSQPELVPFRGQCLTHRAQIMQLRGQWAGAMEEVDRACEVLGQPPPHPAIADALYEKGELHRLRGQFPEAEAAYRAATEWGREPQPGLALLRLAQDQLATAEATIRRVVADTDDPELRPRLLSAFVEVALAADDVAAARTAAVELAEIAGTLRSGLLDAASAYAEGAVALADGDAHGAVRALRRACSLCCTLDTPYEAARARVLLAMACRELGDEDTATMEFDTARRTFAEIGATPDLARLDALVAPRPQQAPAGLTGREIEVLEHIAAGSTNRQIAETLFISEKTVARHVSNIFTKLGVNSRAAATAYAYRHGIA